MAEFIAAHSAAQLGGGIMVGILVESILPLKEDQQESDAAMYGKLLLQTVLTGTAAYYMVTKLNVDSDPLGGFVMSFSSFMSQSSWLTRLLACKRKTAESFVLISGGLST